MASPTPEQKTMPPPPSVPTREDAVEYKKDGSVSRMRSHRGNVPQLPQTKLCPYCPAKFTRTTHLNRHLRNHTNERLYRCEVCGAQFTRSDLLARHKRSCGESHPISRSRKRSCQACTSLKVKCDLRQPCSKCRARGRNCVYITDDDGQREGVAGPSSGERVSDSRPWGPLVRLDASAGFDPSTLGRGASDAFASAFPELSLIEEASNAISQPLSEANLASFMGGTPRVHQGAMSLPTIDASTDITTSSFRLGRPNHAYTSFGASEIAGHSRGLQGFSPTMFEPFFRDVFSIKEDASQQNDQPAAPLLHAPVAGMLVDELGSSDFIQTSTDGMQSFDFDQDRSLVSDLMTNVYYDNTQMPPLTQDNTQAPVTVSYSLPVPRSVGLPTHQPVYAPNLAHDLSEPPLYSQQDLQRPPSLPRPVDDTLPEPTTEELQGYLCIYLTAFHRQIPIVHTQTLRVERKSPLILRAMQACGAIFVKTPVAQAFVEKMLGTSRDMVDEFARPSPDPKHQVHVIMTLLLLQTIGLFHQDPQRRALSNTYHGMLVLMVRQNRLIEQSATWEPQTFPTSDLGVLDDTWRNWALHESIKRMVCLVYCHDQAHPIYFSLPPSFSPEEFATFLPCDDELWGAQSALEWSQLLLKPSPYGSIGERLRGVPMLRAFAAVGLEGPNMTATLSASPAPPDELPAVSPFGHFILLQSILGELFRRCSGNGSPSASPNPGGEELVNEHVYVMQLALHRWLQMWLKTPGAINSPGGTDTDEKAKRRFMADPLPFYWLAQLLLLAFQEGLPPFRSRELQTTSPTRPSDSPNPQVLLDPSPFAPPLSAASPFSPSLFAPSPFSTSSFSSDSSPVMSSTPPPAYRSPSGGPPQAPGKHSPASAPQAASSTATPDATQFRLIKQWLHYIRLFLRRSQGSPTVVWDELMKIRLCGWESDASRRQQHGDEGEKDVADDDSGSWLEGDGILGFFEEKCRI